MATIQTTIELSSPAEDTVRLPVLGAAVAALQREKWTLQRLAQVDGTVTAVVTRAWKIEGAEETRPPRTPEGQMPLLGSTVFPQTPGFGPTLAEDAAAIVERERTATLGAGLAVPIGKPGAIVDAEVYDGLDRAEVGGRALPAHVHRFGEDGHCLEPGCLGTREDPDGPGIVAADPAAPPGQGRPAPVVTAGRRAGTRKVSRGLLQKGRAKRR